MRPNLRTKVYICIRTDFAGAEAAECSIRSVRKPQKKCLSRQHNQILHNTTNWFKSTLSGATRPQCAHFRNHAHTSNAHIICHMGLYVCMRSFNSQILAIYLNHKLSVYLIVWLKRFLWHKHSAQGLRARMARFGGDFTCAASHLRQARSRRKTD